MSPPPATPVPAATPSATVPPLPAKRDSTSPPALSHPSKRDRPTPTDVAPDTAPLQVVLLSPTATLPSKGSPLSAGFDLSASQPATVPPRSRHLVKTGLQVAIPAGCYGRVAPRSGLALKKFIDVGAGVIDADYRGEVGVVLFNFGDEPFEVKAGDRVAQLVLERINMVGVEQVEKLEETERGEGGFGSTGVEKTE